MNYINKIQLPENISSIKDVSEYYDHNINDLITYLFKNTKFNKQDILNFFRALIEEVLGVVNLDFGFAFIILFLILLYPAAIVPDVHA